MARMAILLFPSTSFAIVQYGQIRVNIHILKVRWEFRGSVGGCVLYIVRACVCVNGSVLQGADGVDNASNIGEKGGVLHPNNRTCNLLIVGMDINVFMFNSPKNN